MVDLFFAPEARAEIEAAYADYFRIRPQLATDFEVRFNSAINFIRETPDLGSPYGRRHRFVVLRQFPYVVYYRWDGVKVRVVAVGHSSRRPGYWKGR